MMKYLANNEDEASDMLLELSKCVNCIHFKCIDLFSTFCAISSRHINHESMCELHEPKNKFIAYRINKTVRMLSDYSGMSDFSKQWDFHERNGTEDEFLGINKQ